jgi:hypothetical protein
MKSKVGLDFAEVKRARIAAKEIAIQVQHFVDGYSTVAVERTLCRLLGIDGVDANGVPMPNVVVEHLEHNGKLDNGVIYHIGNAVKETGLSPQVIAEQIVSGQLDLDTLPVWSKEEIIEGLQPHIDAAIDRIRARRARREEFINTLGEGEKTLTVELKVNEHLITFTLKTDKATVGEALIENELVSGDEGPYGLYVKVVNGMTADYDIDQSYWAFYINGEFAMTGIDMTEIKEGEIYRLEYAH